MINTFNLCFWTWGKKSGKNSKNTGIVKENSGNFIRGGKWELHVRLNDVFTPPTTGTDTDR